MSGASVAFRLRVQDSLVSTADRLARRVGPSSVEHVATQGMPGGQCGMFEVVGWVVGHAEAQAEGKALRAAGRILGEPGILTQVDTLLGIALCPVGGPADRTAVLFDQRCEESFRGLVAEGLQADPQSLYPVLGNVHQDALRMWPAVQELGHGWTAAAYWDGSVAVVYSQQEAELSVGELVGRVAQGWRSLAKVATLLQGVGETHVAVVFNAEHAAARARKRSVPTEPARSWTASPAPHEDDVARVQRELRRGFGERAWEPARPNAGA